jgi:ribosomal protein L11
MLIDEIRKKKQENKAEDKKKRIATTFGDIGLDKFKEIVMKTYETKKDRVLENTAVFVGGIAETMGITIDGQKPKAVVEKIKSKEITF